ncbi:MAG: DUF2147 domain-containing protein [Leptospiraceae bacterium]|nr:DUF2147 domain-containing protein [Leptospiraceae bacterium]MCP5510738.1 DUF2147 domain-containing protein [Leptospiraceae bacterium]
MKFRFGLVAFVFLFSNAVLLADPAPVTGLWRTIDDETKQEKSVVEVYEKGGKIFAKIVNLKEPNDESGNPKTCTKCTGEDKNKPVQGLVIVKNLEADGDEWAGGTIMDPSNGKTYKCIMQSIEGGKKLKVRGYIGFKAVGRNQIWLKK